MRYRITNAGAASVRGRVAVSRTASDGTVQQLGTLPLAMDVGPAGSGVPHRYANLERDQDWWSVDVGCWFTDAGGTILLGGRPLGPAPTDDDTFLSVGFTDSGTIS